MIALLGGCRIDFDPLATTDDGTGCTPWSEPALLAEFAGSSSDYAPALDRNGLMLYFTREQVPGTGGRVYSATRPDRTAPFGPATPVPELDVGMFMADVSLTEDDLEMFVVADTNGSVCVWRTTRPTPTSPWATVTVEPATCPDAGGPAISSDGLTLYFQVREDPIHGTLHVATRASRSDPFDRGVPLEPFAGGALKGFPEISTSGLVLYFEAQHGETVDTWQSVRRDPAGPFGPATLLFTHAGDPALSLDGTEMFLAEPTGTDSYGQLYRATRDCP